MSGSSGRRSRGCTSRSAELKMLYDALGIINVRFAGDRRCYVDERQVLRPCQALGRSMKSRSTYR